MSHTTKVTTVKRHAHDLARTIYVVRCTGCTYRTEHHDEERAHREARRHEATAAVGAVSGK